MKLTDLENTIDKYMLRADKGIVRLIAGTMLSNYLPTPPSWMFIVGNSSGGKSMILSALKNVKGIFELDDMTASTFASGMKGQASNSLLFQIPQNGTVLIKDYTTMLSKDKESRAEILGQMRKIFDGDYRKKFGNGEDVQWTGKLGMLAGVTPTIYDQEITTANAAMGERYLYYQMDMPDRFEVAMMSTDDIRDYEAKEQMTHAFSDYLNPKIQRILDEQRSEAGFIRPTVNKTVQRAIVELAEFATRARSAVKRNQYSRDKDQETPPTLEMPTRFAKALICVAYGLLLIHRYDEEAEELTDVDKSILYKIALDSIPLARRIIIEALTFYSTATEDGLVQQLGMSKAFVKLYLADLTALSIVSAQKAGYGWQYTLKQEYRDLIAHYRGIQQGSESLEGENENDTFDSVPFPTNPIY